jgi:hypothetical protein
LNASSLKKLIRQIATDKDFYLKTPSISSSIDTATFGNSFNINNSSIIINPFENGDSAMRRQMMKKFFFFLKKIFFFNKFKDNL